jgi:hypothetical protein
MVAVSVTQRDIRLQNSMDFKVLSACRASIRVGSMAPFWVQKART